MYIGLITIDGQLTSIPWYRILDCSGEEPCYAYGEQMAPDRDEVTIFLIKCTTVSMLS